jgi:hypothetical protein
MPAIVCLLVFVASGTLCAAGKASATGTFEAVEEDGTVVIDGKGYLLSPSARIENSRKELMSLVNLPPSSRVYFEYEYTRSGFVIILIKEMAK